MYRNFTKGGRRMRVKTAKAERWFTDASWMIKSAINGARWVSLDGKTVVDLWVWWPDRRKRDCDNLNKVIMDALTLNHVVKDDSLCLPRWQDYYFDKDNPRVEVDVWQMESGLLITGRKETNATEGSSGGCPHCSVTGLPAIPTTSP